GQTAALLLGLDEVPLAEYEALRLELGVPDGSRDLPVEKAILLENGFDELHGIDWQKGCYMGQELTARTKYRGLVRKRLLPVEIEGPLPAPGTPVMAGDKEAGEMRSGADGLGLALLRLEHLEAGLGQSLDIRTTAWESPMGCARLRDLGITVGQLPPGPFNAITDVAGVRVG